MSLPIWKDKPDEDGLWWVASSGGGVTIAEVTLRCADGALDPWPVMFIGCDEPYEIEKLSGPWLKVEQPEPPKG